MSGLTFPATYHADKKLRADSGNVGKTTVLSMKERAANRIKAKVAPDIKRRMVRDFIVENTARDGLLFTDEFNAYNHIPRRRKFAKHKLP